MVFLKIKHKIMHDLHIKNASGFIFLAQLFFECVKGKDTKKYV